MTNNLPTPDLPIDHADRLKWSVGYDRGGGAQVVTVYDHAPGDLAALLRLLCSGEQR